MFISLPFQRLSSLRRARCNNAWLAFAAVQIFVFSVMVYFLCIVGDAGAFFTFYPFIISGYLAITLFIRTLGCLSPDFDYVIKSSPLI